MNLKEIIEAIEGLPVCTPDEDVEVTYGFASDLMSDVLVTAHIESLPSTSDVVLLTGLTNPQAVRTAEMADIPIIIFVRGKYPSEATIALAEEDGIALVVSPYTMFETAGRLYQAGIQGIGRRPIVKQR